MTLTAKAHDYDECCEQILCLKEQGFTTGLALAVLQQSHFFVTRFWIVDNSGSMNSADGRRLVPTKKRSDVRWVSCTRFAELQECILYHAQLSALLEAPTRFTLLNAPSNGLPQEMRVAESGPDMVEEELQSIKNTLSNVYPRGVTPLTQHLIHMYRAIHGMEATLRREGQRVAVIVATDGLPTDEAGNTNMTTRMEFETALKQLQQLPVWIVVRLCTDEESVLKYYENLDNQLELSLEVLDDFQGEAKEVHSFNPWLTYSLVLHRCREMGFSNRLMDIMDERRFTMEEMVNFVHLLLGKETELPDPHVDWLEFTTQLKALIKHEEKQYNPIKQRATAWIDFRELERVYGPKTFWSEYWHFAMAAFGVLVAVLIAKFGPM